MSRWLTLDGAVNARDVGGLPLDGGGTVAGGRLLRSDNLQDLTPRDLQLLVGELSVRTVIDLRTDNERQLEGPPPIAACTEVAIQARSLYPETGGNTDLDVETTTRPWEDVAKHPDDAAEAPAVRAYLGYLRHRPDSVVEAMRAIASPPDGGAVVVHCAAGKDRTGVVVALALAAAGVPREAIEADYQLTGERIDAIVARLRSSPTYAGEMSPDPQDHAPRPGAMLRVLEVLDERCGGPVAWLREHGLQDGELAALRARLRS